MKRTLFLLIMAFYALNSYSQVHNYIMPDTTDLYSSKTIVHSRYGWRLSPVGNYRSLTIMVNIIYDMDAEDPRGNTNGIWDPATEEGINNQSIPVYLESLLDIEYNPDNVTGILTRLYHESSFGALVILGDFIVVNINHSTLEPSGGVFNIQANRQTVLDLINDNGGLQNALYGYNSIDDYDSNGDGNIDIIQFLWRNTNNSYGGVGSGSGYSGTFINYNIKVDNEIVQQTSNYTNQGVGNGTSTALNPTGITVHEVAHWFFGGNNFHTSGGNHYTGGRTNTFFGTEGGYGLMGGSKTGLVSCNGYERWRMDWTSPDYNPQGYPIQASGVPSDILKEDGPQSFTLRDFVTTGDAVRIKLPYVDEGASNQYIWLENHQIGNNNKLDHLQWSLDHNLEPHHNCRPIGTPGIYAYIQVGKDILEGTLNEVYQLNPMRETDNLRIISTEGNWDFIKLTDEEVNCVTKRYAHTAKRYLPNPLSGYQDQTTHFFNTNNSKLNGDDGMYLNIKYDNNNNLLSDYLPYLGDEFDAFTGTSQMNIGTNPSPANVSTYYVTQEKGNFQNSDANTNTSHIYLSGLRIDLIKETPCRIGRPCKYIVNIEWDDYEVKNDVRWAGNIVLQEKVILKENKTIELDQSLTPNQIYRDPVSNKFAKPTVFTCENDSEFIMEENSEVVLSNKSSLKVKNGSVFDINEDATITLKDGSAFVVEGTLNLADNSNIIVESDATLQLSSNSNIEIDGSGKIEVQPGGYICIEQDASINLSDHNSVIDLQCGYKKGVNTNILPPSNCIQSPITYPISGNGKIIISPVVYFTNQTVRDNKTINHCHTVMRNITVMPRYSTRHTTLTINSEKAVLEDNVTVEDGAKLIINADNVQIDKNFEAQKGSELVIE